jgi:AraC-like DNA-binding protein
MKSLTFSEKRKQTSSEASDQLVAGRWFWRDHPTPSFHLRLAHVQSYSAEVSPLALPRRILDHEWILQIRGDAWLTLPEEKASVILPEGSVTLIPPQWVHAQGWTDSSHIAIHFDLEGNPELKAYDMTQNEGTPEVPRMEREVLPAMILETSGKNLSVPMVQMVKNFDEWVERTHILVETWCMDRTDEPGEQLRAQSVLAWCFHQFFFEGIKSEEQEALESFLSRVDITDRNLRVGDLAKEFGMGETVFRKEVESMTGLPPRSWMESKRCEQAGFLLLDTLLTVKEVAGICGYDDPYHFSRVFRRWQGISPKGFRERGRKEGRFLQRHSPQTPWGKPAG